MQTTRGRNADFVKKADISTTVPRPIKASMKAKKSPTTTKPRRSKRKPKPRTFYVHEFESKTIQKLFLEDVPESERHYALTAPVSSDEADTDEEFEPTTLDCKTSGD
jgi:hypothetical protein